MGNKTVPKYGAQIGTEILWGWRQKTAPKSVPTSFGVGVRNGIQIGTEISWGWLQKVAFKTDPNPYGNGSRKRVRAHRLRSSGLRVCVCVCVCARVGGCHGSRAGGGEGGGMCACREDALTN